MPRAVQLPFKKSPFGGEVTQALSSMGEATTTGPQIDAKDLFSGYRAKLLENRSRYYTCTQHDHKIHDWNGRLVGSKTQIAGVQPLIGSGSLPSQYVAMDQRRPCAPYRLGRVIVNAFTTLLFGHGRWPHMRSEDPETQDFADALVEAAKLRTKMIRARTLGGNSGSVGLSWRFLNGVPQVTVHKSCRVHVLEWEDEEDGIPSHVVELKMVQRQVKDQRTGEVKAIPFWRRRDWTPTADVVFVEQPVREKNPVLWSVDTERTYEHHDGFVHFVWIRNLPDDDEEGVDGQPDYAEVYEQMNTLDVLNSVVTRGAVLNLDPTLVVTLSVEELGNMMLQKGSEHALAVGDGGDAKYLEVSGASINAGVALIDKQRDQILESAKCVVPDPNEIAAQGTSSVALRMIYAPMIGQTDLLRDNYGEGLDRLLTQMILHCRKRMVDNEAEGEDRFVHEEVAPENEGEDPKLEAVEYFVNLPPRREKKQVVDEHGEPTGEEEVEEFERHPGTGDLWLEWGEYFKPTADDRVKSTSALSSATGGKPIMSQRTAVEINAGAFERDGSSEWNKVVEERTAQAAREEEMFPPIGGDGEQPEAEDQEPQPVGGVPKINLAPADIAKVVTVNEARASQGLGPRMLREGGEDPDGYLTIAEFDAKMSAKGEVQGASEGEQAAQESAAATGGGTPPAGNSGP